ncbi:MAG TPA: universal stress protein [Acidimicrobiales bacterium]|nr:universal stress protein [Acidimicrobiales bacterium]
MDVRHGGRAGVGHGERTAPAEPPTDRDGAGAAGGVVVGVDGSEHSLRALDWAADEAGRRGVPLVVLHANFWTDDALRLPAFAEQRDLDAAALRAAVARARQRQPGLTVVGRATAPPAAEALVDASRDAVLVVVGTRGLRLVDELALGSVSHHLACHAHCPVVMVPGPAPAR